MTRMAPVEPVVLETRRLLLRPFRSDDLPDLQRYAVRPGFWRYLPIEEQTSETVAAFLAKRLADPPRMPENAGIGTLNFAVEAKHLGSLIGTARLGVTSRTHPQGDLGFALDSEHAGQGYMTEAVRQLLTFGFDECALHRIQATADVENARSWRLMERIGMRREGLLRQDKLVRGVWRDSVLYAILSSDPR